MNSSPLTSRWQFRPSIWGVVLTCCLMLGFVKLGLWQQAKAERKEAAQALLERKGADARLDLGATLVDPGVMQYTPVRLVGQLELDRQFFVDNRVHKEQPGYHVITPLKRGWIPALARHADVPQVSTPTQEVTWQGVAVVPGTKFFTLGAGAESVLDAGTPGRLLPPEQWPQVWQNLDLQRFARAVPYPVQPVVVLLDAKQEGGFERDWVRPDDRFEKHWSYAYQWYGFAATALVICLYLGFKREPA